MTDTPNILGGLIEMARAVEENPMLKAEIARLQALVASQEHELHARENHIEMLRNAHDDVSTKLRSAEVERDNAGFRQLAAEDALNTIKRVVQTSFHQFGETLKSVTPEPTAEPVAEAVPAPFAVHTEPSTGTGETTSTTGSDPVPTAPTTTDTSPPVQSGTADASGGASSGTSEAAGQREPDPTPAQTDATSGMEGPISTTGSSPQGPYVGKCYWDTQVYVTERQWLEGGGSYEGYHWRPGMGDRPRAVA